jgi:hypothetical protein
MRCGFPITCQEVRASQRTARGSGGLKWEDRHVIETHDPPEVPRVGETSVRADRATLAFRRYYDRVLCDSYATLPTAPATEDARGP